MPVKFCRTCKEEKDLSQFRNRADQSDGKHYACKTCCNASLRNWKNANPDKKRGYDFKYTYGITLTEYRALYAAQQGLCSICLDPYLSAADAPKGSRRQMLFVDHDHTTNEVRGLLCGSCNSALGYARENPDILKRMIDYLTNGLG